MRQIHELSIADLEEVSGGIDTPSFTLPVFPLFFPAEIVGVGPKVTHPAPRFPDVPFVPISF
jgi:hypothetical protein